MKPVTLRPLDVRVRLDELSRLGPGWLDGKGVALNAEGLGWLAEAFDRSFPDDLPLPHLYPTAEGGVRAEWSIRPYELSLEIDLVARGGIWHWLNLEDDAEQSRKVSLAGSEDWAWLSRELRKRGTTVP